MGITKKTCTVTAEQIGRVDRVIQSLTELSRSKVQALFDHGFVSVNDQPCSNVAQRVALGDVVLLQYDPHQGYKEKKKPWSDRTFSNVFEDEHLIVVNKVARVLTVATDTGDEENTLQARVQRYVQLQNRRHGALVVHRLDREASGLIVFAKNAAAEKSLHDQFHNRRPFRQYSAIVFGTVATETGSFQSYVAVGENLDHYSTWDKEEGVLSVTHYQCTALLDNATLVNAYSEAGHPNQIRLHFAQAGHPVLGDERYIRKIAARERDRNQKKAQAKLSHPNWTKNRMAIHASKLSFVHPATEATVTFESPIPKAMALFMKANPDRF